MKLLKYIQRNVALLALVLVVVSCKEELNGPLGVDGAPPGTVSNIKVTNLPGKALIQYTPPADQDLLYVKALYTLANGKQVEVKSSYYKNQIEVEGFADTIEHNIQLFAVDRGEVVSEPVDVKVKPKENPIWGTYRSLSVIPSFGGLQISAENEAMRDLTIMVMVDSLGEWVPSIDNIYTSTRKIKQNIRGLDTVPKTFAITIRDRWLNYTDTLITKLTPLYEAPIPQSGYRSYVLPGDAQQAYSSTSLAYMWDGLNFHWPNISMTTPSITTPQWVTFDLGKPSKLSRIVIWDYAEYTNSGRIYYMGGDMRNFEIWGSDNPPADGSWNNWNKLGEYEQVKPSGNLTPGTQTTEDYNYAFNGISYDLELLPTKTRYIRIKCNRNWSGTTYMAIAEVQVFGDPR